ncbi:MAG: ABC transporter permease [Anaerolineaceae bacterium]|jgi:ABC-2 type transport system permease protein|nr:MAG: ABC transporter permease [Anaerolineaceae bacterium]
MTAWQKIKCNLRVIFMAFEIEFRQSFTDAFVLFGIIVQPMIVAFMALWMLKDQVANYAIFVVVGSAMTGLWTTLLFQGGNSITGERWTGTLEPLTCAPAPLRAVVSGKLLASITQSLLSIVFCYTFISLIMGLPLTIAKPWLFFGSILLTVVAFIAFGLIIGSLFIINPDVQRFQNGLEFVVYIFSGFLFPIALLPMWTTPFSYILTPYWAARALHAASSGSGSDGEIFFCWVMLILFSVVYAIVSKFLFQAILRKAREDATLNMQ